jgi:membrane protein
MTIGPAPMIMIDWMSVRLGMYSRAKAQKKGAQLARPPDRAEDGSLARGGVLDQIRRPGKGTAAARRGRGETMRARDRYKCMSLSSRMHTAARHSNKGAWIAGMALAGTYALATLLDRGKERPATTDDPSPVASYRLGWAGWKDVLYRTYEAIIADRLLALAAGVVFFGLLALFPAITALVSSYALFATVSTITDQLAMAETLMPASAFSIVEEQVNRIVSRTTGDLSFTFLFGLVLALWSANAGVKAIIDALNVIYGVKERRGFVRLNLVSLGFTVGTISGLLLAIAAIVVLPIVLSYLPLGGYGPAVMTWLRWPALLALVVLGLGVLYRFGPNRDKPRWQLVSPGTVFAAVAWLAGSAALSFYLGNFANYDATYGSLGAAIGLMMWLWMTAIVVLIGAELNSQIDAVMDSRERARQERPENKIGGGKAH